jgi:hypothetical protein
MEHIMLGRRTSAAEGETLVAIDIELHTLRASLDRLAQQRSELVHLPRYPSEYRLNIASVSQEYGLGTVMSKIEYMVEKPYHEHW